MRFPRGTCYKIRIGDESIKFKLLDDYSGMPNIARAKICTTGEIVDAFNLLRYDISSLEVVNCDEC